MTKSYKSVGLLADEIELQALLYGIKLQTLYKMNFREK